MPSDPLAALRPIERRRYRLADFLVRKTPWLSIAWNKLFMVNLVRLLALRRLDVRGMEHLAGIGPDARVILVANHRSFFDFFVIGAILYMRTSLPKCVVFPTRGTFFYDHALGGVVSGVMSGFTMFPPILRDATGARRGFNLFALERCVEHLSEPGRMLGVHPEGKRNTNEDIYSLLPAQSGTGRVALGVPGVVVVPVWVMGLTNSIPTEAKRNWTAPDEYPIDVRFGAPVAFEDLRDRKDAAAAVTERMMDAVAALAAEHKAEHAPLRRAS